MPTTIKPETAQTDMHMISALIMILCFMTDEKAMDMTLEFNAVAAVISLNPPMHLMLLS